MARATARGGRARGAPVRQSARQAAASTKAVDSSDGSESEGDGDDGGDVSPYFRKRKAVTRTTPAKPKPKPATKTKPAAKAKAKTGKSATPRAKAGGRKRNAAEPTGLTDESSDSNSGSDSGSASSSSDLSDDPDAFRPSDDDEDESDPESVDSDDLDAPARARGKGKGKAKRAPVKSTRPAKRARRNVDEDEDDEDEIELEEGQEIAGRIHPAPTKGKVPPGRISQNTLDFLAALYYPANNDREWFKSHEPAFRQAEKEWRDFAQILQEKMSEVDVEVPVLPARDICHRIYRDIRFSSDKTPYKANFGLTTSRSGRRGIWAGYHMYMGPHNHSLIACGAWQPEKEQLELFRQRVIANSAPLRAAISDPEFVKLFGPPKPKAKEKGKAKARGPWDRQNVFGHSDELKVAPKGVDKNHKDIDLLRLRTIAVARRFTDAQVLDPDFMSLAQETIRIMAPFVHTLNAYLAPRGHPDAIDAGQVVVVQDSDSD